MTRVLLALSTCILCPHMIMACKPRHCHPRAFLRIPSLRETLTMASRQNGGLSKAHCGKLQPVANAPCCRMQASLERPSNKSTGPSDADIVDGWKPFTKPIED